jgi:hypothetical protein
MPTVKRSSKGIEMQPGSVSVRATEELTATVLDVVSDEPNTQSSAHFRETCHVTKALKPDPAIRTVEGLEWSMVDRQGEMPHTYICEGRAMKISLNLRRERGEAYQEGVHEWILFRMGVVLARSTSLEDLFATAALS